MVLGCRDPYFIVLDGRDPYSSRVYLTVFHAVSIMGCMVSHVGTRWWRAKVSSQIT